MSAGSYTVSLKVTAQNGKEATVTKTVTVEAQPQEPAPITVDFTYTIDDLTASFVSTVENAGNKSLSYYWTFGNDGIDYTANPQFTFPFSDVYRVTLQVFIDGDYENPVTVSKDVNVVSTAPVKLYAHVTDGNEPEKNSDYMYFAIRVKGVSPGGYLRQLISNEGWDYAYPRDLEYMHSNDVYTKFQSSDIEALCGMGYCIGGYSSATGFANEEGTEFDMPFYLSDNNFRVKINGANELSYVFKNFAVTDNSVTEFMGHPVFIRYNATTAFTVTIPMTEYNPLIHKNIANVTVNFTVNGDSEPYEITFDGYELK